MNHLDKIDHFFVLYLENRSFDHVFGLSAMTGTDATTLLPTTVDGLPGHGRQNDVTGASHAVRGGAKLALTEDIGHEFSDVKVQLCGDMAQVPYATPVVRNEGFVLGRKPRDPNLEDPLLCFEPSRLPVLHALAKEFAICDRWFAAMPGPTFPNRMFVHAATSGGIAASPSTFAIVGGDLAGYSFNNGHIFGRLRAKGIPWAIYAPSAWENMSVLLDGVHHSDVRSFDAFAADIQEASFEPAYVFIEPHYDSILPWAQYKNGNSMHPLNDVTHGELLVKTVYDALRRSPLWEKSMLIIAFDEHGGFYDHVPPPAAVPPGDGHRADSVGFDFAWHGARVPAIVVSPLIEQNRIVHTQLDHTSILKTVFERFRLDPLTQRDFESASLAPLVTLGAARTVDDLKLATAPAPAARGLVAQAPPPGEAPLDRSSQAFVLAAAMVEAKLRGPDAWDEIAATVNGLDGQPLATARAYVAQVEATLQAEAAKEAAKASVSVRSLADMDEAKAEPAMPPGRSKAGAEAAMAQYGGDVTKAAWSLRISRNEMNALLNGA